MVFAFRQSLFRPLAAQDSPHAVHKQRQLSDVVVLVVFGLVADTGDGHDPAAVKHGDVHVARELDVSRRGALLVGDWARHSRCNDRFSLADRFAPESRVFHRIDDGLIDLWRIVHGAFDQ